jgi:RND family efflux transporter MFP subunit
MRTMMFMSSQPCFVAAVAWCATSLALAQPAPAVPLARPAMTVTLAKVEQVNWPQVISASGTVVPWHEALVSARSSGLAATEVLVDRGSRVKSGQVLVRFDDRGLRADVVQAEAALAQAQAAAEQARRNRDRTLSLSNTGAVTEQDELQAVTTATSTAAQWHQARAALDGAKVRLDNATITSPDDGTVSSRSISLGQVPGSGMELFKLIRQDRLEWRAEVPAQYLTAVRAGQSAEVMLPDGGRAKGRVKLVLPALDGASRLGVVAVELVMGSTLRAEMFLQGTLQVGRAPAVVLPSGSLVLRDGRAYVFVLSGERVRRVAVTAGRRVGKQVEVTSGVAVGDNVVVRGAGFLVDGDLVRVTSGATPKEPNARPAL